MKRPPQIWVISIGLLCLSLFPSTNALRATSLIFAKTSTTTTTTDASAAGEAKEEVVTVANEPTAENQTATKPPLTGIPQIDYIWDPNLPFELKNYNLSDYPFYDRVPEVIDFKCDGLHDGFYASIPHKCQVYHHCLYGTRYDFLCANFTAFDQKTFICHFVSEVDCDNSKNFWHRNDALYKAAETTTVAPVTTTSIPFTPSPALNPALRRPSPALLPGGGARRRRPYRRRRPQYDYYYEDDAEYDAERGRDDYYDDPPLRNGGRRRRPRPNRRPEYEEYEEYEDDRYDRRPGRRDEDRRPYDRREDDRRRPVGGNKNKDRRVDDEDEDDRRRPVGGSKNKDRKVDGEDNSRTTDDKKRPADDRRRPLDEEYERRPYDRRKPSRDRYEDEEDDRRRPYDRKRPQDEDDRRYRPKDSKTEDEERRYRPNDTKVEDERDDRRNRKPLDEGRLRPKDAKTYERSRPTEEPKVLIKPSSGSSVYDRPRAPPIIRRPMPKTERDKYGYKPPVTIKAPVAKLPEDEEYYDEYEDEPKLPAPKPTRKSTLDSRESEERRVYVRPRRPQLISKKPVPPVDDLEDEPPRRALPKRPLDRSQERPKDQDRSQERSQERSREQANPKTNNSNKKSPIIEEEEYIDEYEEVKSPKPEVTSRERSRPKFNTKEDREAAAVRTETTSREAASREREHRPEPLVKIVKRPFLPSRGGNPYVGRGLQPVGNKALDITTDITEKRSKEETSKSQEQIENSSRQNDNLKPIKPFQSNSNENQLNKKSSSQEEVNKSTEQSKQQSDEYYDDEEFKPVTSRPKNEFRNFNLPRTTQKPKVSDNFRNPLDINENEYDVTLNDALNPTLPNLPVRSVPTGFSNGRDGYIAQNFQRPRLIPVESAVLSPASSDYVYQVKQPQNSQVHALRYNPYVTVQQLNYRQSPASSGQYYTTY